MQHSFEPGKKEWRKRTALTGQNINNCMLQHIYKYTLQSCMPTRIAQHRLLQYYVGGITAIPFFFLLIKLPLPLLCAKRSEDFLNLPVGAPNKDAISRFTCNETPSSTNDNSAYNANPQQRKWLEINF